MSPSTAASNGRAVALVLLVAVAAAPAAARAQADPTSKDSLADTVRKNGPTTETAPSLAGTPGDATKAGYLPGYRKSLGLSLSPYAPEVPALPGGMTVPFSAPERTDDWAFNFWGYMSASLRAGVGSRDFATADQAETTLHTYPRIVDAYGLFAGTNVPQGSWVDLTFEYGNNRVVSHVKISTWKPGVGSDWTPLGSQNLFQEAYLTFKLPVGPLNFKWNVGAFRNTYGGLGQYDVGHYNAAIIGSPTGVGETLTAQYDLNARYTLFVEDGFMGGFGKVPVGPTPVISIDGAFNPSLPSSFVHHAHAGIARHGTVPLILGLHYLRNFAQDERDQIDDPRTPFVDEGRRPDPHMDVVGVDFRMIDNYLGNFAVAASYADAHYATLLQGMTFFGAYSGEQMTRRYFGTQTGGTAKMLVTGLEYNVAWQRLLRYPVELSPNGPDVFSSFFFDFARTDSRDPDFHDRLFYKFGTELTWRLQRWVAFSGRVDRVVPNSLDPLESFWVVCPRILLKTDWLSHETVTLAWTKWFYGPHTHTEFPNAYSPGQLDDQMFSLMFGLWF
jgi:hypothetical protein